MIWESRSATGAAYVVISYKEFDIIFGEAEDATV